MKINIFTTYFADPCPLGKIEHKFFDVILLTNICGHTWGRKLGGYWDVWWRTPDWLKLYGDFELGVPGHDTIARVISRINAKQLQSSFIEWMQDCQQLSDGSVIAIGGKTVRRSFDKKHRKAAIHMVSAFSTSNRKSPWTHWKLELSYLTQHSALKTQHFTLELSIKKKRLKAALSESYLSKVIEI